MKRKNIRMLECHQCGYKVNAFQEGVKVPGKVPECPGCRISLSFEGAGALVPEGSPSWIFLAGLFILLPITLFILLNFREFDNRTMHPNTPIRQGEMIYGGEVRFKKSVEGGGWNPFKHMRRRFFRPPSGEQGKNRMIEMVTYHYAYIFQKIEKDVLSVQYRFKSSDGRKEEKILRYRLRHGQVLLTIPPIAALNETKKKVLLLDLQEDGLYVSEERIAKKIL